MANTAHLSVCHFASALVLCGLLTAAHSPAYAVDAAWPSMTPQSSSELSAQKKKRWQRAAKHPAYYGDPTRSPYYLRPGVAPSFGYVGPPGYAGEYAWRRSIGQCVEDLGYGRWSACGAR